MLLLDRAQHHQWLDQKVYWLIPEDNKSRERVEQTLFERDDSPDLHVIVDVERDSSPQCHAQTSSNAGPKSSQLILQSDDNLCKYFTDYMFHNHS